MNRSRAACGSGGRAGWRGNGNQLVPQLLLECGGVPGVGCVYECMNGCLCA